MLLTKCICNMKITRLAVRRRAGPPLCQRKALVCGVYHGSDHYYVVQKLYVLLVVVVDTSYLCFKVFSVGS